MHKSFCLWRIRAIGVSALDIGGFQIQGDVRQWDLTSCTLKATHPNRWTNGRRDEFCRFCRILVRIRPGSVKKTTERAAWIRNPSF